MRQERSLVPATEVALTAVSLAAVISFSRLFANGSFFWRLAAFAVGSHAVAIVARRLRWSLAASGALSLVALAGVVAVALYPDTTIAGIPTSDTIRALREDLAHVYTQFQSVQAPTPVTTGFLLAAGLALWWAAFVADWAAFRLWVPFESVVPAGTVFVFASLFAAKQHRVESAAVFVAAVLVFLLLHRVTRQQVSTGWMSTDVRRGINAMLGVGVLLTAGTVLAGVVIGPRTPGAGADALVNWRGDRNGPGSRTTVSPFVEIKKRLVDQSLVELFRVQSDQRAYWRLTALDQFDGNLWSSNGSYERASSSLPTDVDSNAPKTVVTQSFTIKSLSTIWVPAAFEPKRLDAKGTSVRYEPASSTLIVGTDLASSDGTSYTVQSAQPVFQPNELASAPPDIPNDIRTRDLALPNMSSTAAELAKQITAGLGSSFDKARALQDYFRNNFEYSLDVPQGESTSAIDAFLASKSGYCEQFAGAYAAMARSVGLPARVAVGFTPGEELTPGTFVVRGEHAHAWPEVYIQGQGWVLFEPTPTRGAPNAQQYTGVPEQQSTGGGVGVTTLVPTTQVTTPSSGPASATPTTNPQERDPLGGLTSPSSKSFWATWWPRAAIGLLVVVLLLAVYAAAVPTLHAMRRRQRRANAVEPTDRVRVAWDESVEAVSLLGLQPKHSETPAEFAARTDPVLDGEMVSTLATSLEAADYSAAGVDEAEALQATALAAGIEEAVRERTTPQQRARALLDPRSSDRRRTRRSSRRGPVTRGDAPPIEMLKPL